MTLLKSVVVVSLSGVVAAAPPRPNIVLIMADDMGYSDIGCYGGEIETPYLDALAADGLRYTQFYNTSRCCPTRASLMSGLYPHQAGVGHMMSDRGSDAYRGDLGDRCLTIAEVLRGAGYRTYMSGKWHVTRHMKPDGPKHNWPLQRGFDRFYGTITGAGSFFDPHTLVRGNAMISPFADDDYAPVTYYYTDAITDHAVRFVEAHAVADGDAPFFLYVPYTAAHWPMHALPEDVARYDGRYDAGYAAIRAARYERMKSLGVIDAGWPLSPDVREWASFEHKEWEAACMEVYAAMVDRMDQGVGRILWAIERAGLTDDTLILYLQDNGACAETWKRKGATPRAGAPTLDPVADDHVLTQYPAQTRDGWPILTGPAVMPGPADVFTSYGRAWANVSNTPFREYKHWVHEGGIATPLIARWPKGIARRGEIERQPGHLIDIMATCVDVAGAAYPGGKTPLEGTSLATTFTGGDLGERTLYWEHEGNRAVRVGDWKLVAKGRKGEWELYDMGADRSEMNDLAAREPERVETMAAAWQAWAERTGVVPWP